MSLNSVEHRTASRFAMQIPVELLFDDGGKVSVVTRDVSASGVFLEVDRDLQLKNRLRFLITFPKEITTSCRIVTLCDGAVVRKESDGNREGLAIKIERYEFLGSKP
jgi:PilZ domain